MKVFASVSGDEYNSMSRLLLHRDKPVSARN
jgi:hypothetical protein